MVPYVDNRWPSRPALWHPPPMTHFGHPSGNRFCYVRGVLLCLSWWYLNACDVMVWDRQFLRQWLSSQTTLHHKYCDDCYPPLFLFNHLTMKALALLSLLFSSLLPVEAILSPLAPFVAPLHLSPHSLLSSLDPFLDFRQTLLPPLSCPSSLDTFLLSLTHASSVMASLHVPLWFSQSSQFILQHVLHSCEPHIPMVPKLAIWYLFLFTFLSFPVVLRASLIYSTFQLIELVQK